MNAFDEEVLWEAIKSCNPKYDGAFYYAVKSTKIVCRPSCKSRTPLRKNVSFFSVYSLAVQEGYRPCKRCRPDLLEPPNEEEVLEAAKAIMDQDSSAPITLAVLAKSVGMSKFHLQRLFKRKMGISPVEYLTAKRMSNAAALLLNRTEPITEIALFAGYKSSSHFSVSFKKYFGCSPTEYRNEGMAMKPKWIKRGSLDDI
jgi:AraC family transcriptional regulator, regulatory protein of adaptative response / methylphosphotriester-DNA alkyltransferase methyltransferase